MSNLKDFVIELLGREDVAVLDIENLMEEIQPRDGTRRHQLTGVKIITVLDRTVRSEREQPTVMSTGEVVGE